MKKRILIVEDELIIALSMRKIIENLGFEVIDEVSEAHDAISTAHREKPDLIFMDIKIEGEMDGIDTTREIQKFSDVPIIFLTGNSDSKTQKKVQSVKSAGFLVKPITQPELKKTLEEIFQKD